MYENHPDLFPKAMGEGYTLHDLLDPSRELPDVRRRFKLRANQEVYTICLLYVLPYMTGYTDDVEKGLFLLSFDLPYGDRPGFWSQRHVFRERLAERLGHNSLVGSTVRQPETLPEHLLADENTPTSVVKRYCHHRGKRVCFEEQP